MLRSGTALIEGIALMMIPDANSVVIDGYCALVVCATIGVGCIYGYAYTTLNKHIAYKSSFTYSFNDKNI